MNYQKQCKKCNTVKPIDSFNKDNYGKKCEDGNKYKSVCKECIKQTAKKYYTKNKSKLIDNSLGYYYNNKEKRKEYTAEYYKKNKKELNKRNYEYVQERQKVDLDFKFKLKLRGRCTGAVRKQINSAAIIELLGCDIHHAREHLENQFTEGMTWDNHGEWHIDHIIPCSSFDLLDPEQQKKCFHYTNLQPLWAIDNLKKSDNI